MAQGWRGFGRERHGALKGVLAVIAVAGFAVGWFRFALAQPEPVEHLAVGQEPATAVPPTPAPSRTPTALPGGGAPTAAATATPSATSAPPEPEPAQTRPKRSRGS